MKFSIVTEYSLWFVPVCFFASLAITFFLYRKRKGFEDISKRIVNLLFVLRFLFVFIISLLLLSPLFKDIKQNIQKPIIIIAQDNSSSLVYGKDSLFYKTEYPAKLQNLYTKLKNRFEVKVLSFSENVKDGLFFDFDGKQTDYSMLMEKIKQVYSNRNVGALILATDGIYTKGSNPLYEIKDFDFPVYTIALGDTGIYKDIALADVVYNKIAFLGNKFPAKVFVEMKKLKDITSQLRVTHNNKLVFSKNITALTNDYYEEVDFEIEAGETGIQHYKLSVLPVDSEINIKNNHKDIIVEVIDGKQNILLLSNSPHPDIAAIKYAVETNYNFEFTASCIENFSGNISDYNLIILHQLPSVRYPAVSILNTILKKQIPVLFIIGEQTSIKDFNNLKTGFYIRQSGRRYQESTAIYNEDFVLFTNGEEIRELFQIAPPLFTPFADYKIPLNSDVLAYQEIKNIETSKPLIAFSKLGGHKTGFISGEGIWRWRIYDYINNHTHKNFDILLNKIFQYLSLKIKKKRFVVNFKNIYNETEPLIFNAEVYNQNYELVDDYEVRIDIINSENQKFPFVFNSSGGLYRLDAGNFPAGDYRFNAFVKIRDTELKYSGKFTVMNINIESLNTCANHKLLYGLADNTNGKMFHVAELDDLQKSIFDNKNIVPVSYSEKSLSEIINFKLLFFVLFTFITMEWFLRKYFGNY